MEELVELDPVDAVEVGGHVATQVPEGPAGFGGCGPPVRGQTAALGLLRAPARARLVAADLGHGRLLPNRVDTIVVAGGPVGVDGPRAGRRVHRSAGGTGHAPGVTHPR